MMEEIDPINESTINDRYLARRSTSPEHHRPWKVTQQAIDVYLKSAENNGQIKGLGYWQVANGYTAIALHEQQSKRKHNLRRLVQQVYRVGLHHKNYVNEFNDDSMWWAICLLEMHKVLRHPYYIETAYKIRQHVRNYVLKYGKYNVGGNDMENGVLWTTRHNESNVNAITTGLYSELSARLAVHMKHPVARQKLVQEAQMSLFWVLRNRYVKNEFLVLDTINVVSKETLDWTFTYNTAQAMAAAIAIYDAVRHHYPDSHNNKATAQYLELACNMAQHAMVRPSWVEKDGTLTERSAYPGGANKKAWENDDAVGFKSVLIRSLTKLYLTLKQEKFEPELQQQIAKFIKWNFHSLRTRDTNGKGQYGPWWAGPMDVPTSHSQMAVLDVMAAIHAVSKH